MSAALTNPNLFLSAMAIEQMGFVAVTLLFPPLLLLIVLILILAITGKSLGIRRFYVRMLLRIFEWGKQCIREHQKALSRHGSASSSMVTEDSGINSSGEEDEDAQSPSTPDTPVFSAIPEENVADHPIETASNVIRKEASKRVRKISQMGNLGNWKGHTSAAFTVVHDSLEFMKAGIEAIIDDEVTSRFKAEELLSWNMLTRTSLGYHYINMRLTLLWVAGFLVRYGLLLPARFFLFCIGILYLVTCTAFIGYLPDGKLKRWLNRVVTITCNRIQGRALSAIVTYHNPENMAKPGGICVANHTSPIDVMILSSDNCYALVGQKQGGLLGVIQRALNRATSHIWFERAEANDRAAVSSRLRSHASDLNKLPILIFPEGTCINNTSVMMFKKGSFEIGCPIYPVAIKYDSRFGDPFWNSSEQGWTQYIMMMMTSWALVCDVWYLPPMTIAPGENAVQFANRVKAVIAEQGGMVDLEWDGQLKRYPVKPAMLEEQRVKYSDRVKKAM